MSSAKPTSLTQRFRDKLEYAGNKLPYPAMIFVLALALTWIASLLLASVQFSEVDPRTVVRDASGRVTEVEVRVGAPDFRRSALPARGTPDELWGESFALGERTLPGYAVSLGNPHLVFPLRGGLDDVPLEALGPLSMDMRFPEGMNVHLMAQLDQGLDMCSWERGTGPTLACGSGAVAVFAVAERLGLVGKHANVRMPGGTVAVSDEDGALVMRGPAREVFRGEIQVE